MITKQELLEFGMIETTGDEGYFRQMKKIISEESDEGELGHLAIGIVHTLNVPELCLMMPDGSALYLRAETIQDLKTFEKMIVRWEPNW